MEMECTGVCLLVKQEAEAETAGGQECAQTVGMLGVLTFGTSMGLHILYAAFSLFGEKKIRPSDLEVFASWGRAIYLPERELPLYLIGCVATLLLNMVLYQVWRKRLNLVLLGERSVFAFSHGLELALLALGSAFPFFGLIFVERKVLHRLPLSLAATFLYLGVEIAVFAQVLQRSRSFFTPLAQRWLAGFSAETNRAPITSPIPLSGNRNNLLWDILVPLTLFILILTPNAHRQAGFGYTIDHFHHWDYYVMAPAVGYTHGGALGTHIYAQYGVGWPMLFVALSPLLPLSYGNLIFVGMIYQLIYFLGVYVCLRYLFQDGKWAAGGLFIAFLLLFYVSDINENPWVAPSSTCLRSPCDIWFFLALLLHVRTQRASALYAASVLTGVGLLFGTDTGIYLSATFGVYLLYYLLAPDTKGPAGETGATAKTSPVNVRGSDGSKRRWATCVVCGGMVLAVLLPGLWIASRGTLFQSTFLTGWLEVFLLYPSGISMLPIFSLRVGVFTSFLIVGTYVGVVAWALIQRQARQASALAGWLLSVSVFGLLYMLQFIGRSSGYTTFHVILPFSLLVIIGIKAFAETFLTSTHGNGPGLSQRSWFLWGWALAGTFLLVTLPTTLPMFRRYPGLTLGFRHAPPLVTQTLLPATHDVLLPEKYTAEVQQFVQTAQEIHRLTTQGRRVAILSNDDTALYLASGTPLWCRYSPVLPSLITKAHWSKSWSNWPRPPPIGSISFVKTRYLTLR